MKQTLTYSLHRCLEGKREDQHNQSSAGWLQQNSSLEKMMELHSVDGKAIMPGELTHSGRCDAHLSGFSCLIVDIDNADPDGPMTTWEQAKDHPFIRDNAAVMWTSTNHQRLWQDTDTDYDHVVNIEDKQRKIAAAKRKYQGQDRYRVLFLLTEPFRICPAGNKQVIKLFHQYIQAASCNIDGYDNNIRPSQYFAGSFNGDIHYFDEANRLDLNTLDLTKSDECDSRSATATTFNGTTDDSIKNVRTWMEHVPPVEDRDEWLRITGWLRNIAAATDEESIYQIWDEWSRQADSYSEYGNQQTWHSLEADPEMAPFNKLKNLAVENGYQPPQQAAFDVQSFGTTEAGYLAQSYEKSALTELPNAIEIASVTNSVEAEPPSRKIRMILEELLGKTNKIRFNELTDEIEILGKPMPAYEFDVAEHYLDEVFGVMVTNAQAKSALKRVAQSNRYHPVREYLEYLNNSNLEDIDLGLVASRCLGADDELTKAQVSAWLCGAVSKALDPQGSSFIEVLTLVSPKQGIGKSEFFKSLASPDWFSDSFAQTETEKDRLLVLHSAWINEISEVDQFASNKRDFKAMKGLISTTADKLRVPYGAVTETRPRRFVMGATSNAAELFSFDDEQRRFWTVQVQPTTPCGRLDIEWLRENRDRIWATATRMFVSNPDQAFKLSAEHKRLTITRNADDFKQVSNIADKVIQQLEYQNISAITTNEVLNDLCDIINPTKAQQMEVGSILRSQGYDRRKNYIKHGKKFSVVYVNAERGYDYPRDAFEI